jgi:hypothetical protein
MQAMQTIGAQQAAGRALRPVPQHKPPETGLRTQRIEITGQQIVRLANGGGLLALGTRAVPITGNSAVPSMALLRALAAENVRAAATLLTMAGNTGVGGQRVQMDETTRFESRPGEFTGRMYDRMPDGSWQAREGGYVGFAVEMGFRVLSEEELRNLRAPITTPALPPSNTNPPPLPVQGNDREGTVLPGAPAAPPTMPTIESYPAEQMRLDDLIMQSNRDNNRVQADQRYRDNPSLQDPSRLAGTRVPGAGTWGYPDQPRTPGTGTGYQEQLQGVPYGLELNVGGQIDNAGNISGGAWLDGYEVRDGQVVLVDRKDWTESYAEFASREQFKQDKVLEEALRQRNAAEGTGARIEWQFSNKDAAIKIRDVLDAAGYTDIDVVVVPKK